MRRWLVFFFLLSSLLFLVSCRTTEVVEKPELAPIVDPVLQMRPDNTKLEIKTDIVDIYDVVENSAQYLLAWEMWQSYAEALEHTIADITEIVDGS